MVIQHQSAHFNGHSAPSARNAYLSIADEEHLLGGEPLEAWQPLLRTLSRDRFHISPKRLPNATVVSNILALGIFAVDLKNIHVYYFWQRYGRAQSKRIFCEKRGRLVD